MSEVLGQTERHRRICLLCLVLDYNRISLIARAEVRRLPGQSHLNLPFCSALNTSAFVKELSDPS